MSAATLVAGAAGGWWIRSATPVGRPASGADAGPIPGAVWTCSMHPQIRLPRPGRCPICGMDLIPAGSAEASGGAVRLGPEAARIAGIEVLPIGRRPLAHELRAVGRIEVAEPRVAYLSARIDGRVERLFMDTTGVPVARGEHLVEIYSPDLVVAQQELLRGAERSLARQKLLLLGVTEEQIAAVEKSGQPSLVLTLFAPQGGTVLEKSVRAGMYVKAGDPLYTIADLSLVWLFSEIYEFDVPWLRVGQEAEVEVEAAPGRVFAGRVAFVSPVVQEATRTIRVRVNLPNPEGLLKPGMFGRVRVAARLSADGRTAEALPGGRYTCLMHPEVASEDPGSCPVCGMALKPREPPEKPPSPGTAELLAVPVSAVLDTGVRRVVYVERKAGEFEASPVTLGPRAGDWYPVLSGLAEGDRVVVRAAFLIDSQAQIEGKPSLLFPEGVTGGAAGAHAGHAQHEKR
jgi:Cu(I)/Ag(I) efflux system membrane fusion protein